MFMTSIESNLMFKHLNKSEHKQAHVIVTLTRLANICTPAKQKWLVNIIISKDKV